MKPARILMLLAASQALTACDDWNAVGPRLEAPQETTLAPCAHPSAYLATADWEILAGRLGDELLDCRAKQAALADWARGVDAAQPDRALRRSGAAAGTGIDAG